jgi:hypothetical protein
MSIEQQTTPTLFMFGLIFLIFLGSIFLKWGRGLPGRGLWFFYPVILLFLALLGFDSGLFQAEGWTTQVWSVGWVWNRYEQGAITIGLYQDPLAVMMIFAFVMTAILVLLNKNVLMQEPFPERVLSGVTFSVAGVSLAWISGTPWLSFLGLMISLLGALFALGSRWQQDLQADFAIRFVFERFFGLILAILGALILSSLNSGVLLQGEEFWLSTNEKFFSTCLGSVLLFLGLYIQMQPFPLLGWLFSQSELATPFRVFLCQISPGWAALSVFIRLHSQFVHLGLFPVLGWVALVSCIFTLVSGLFQKDWKLSINAWVSGGLSLSICVLAFSGSLAAVSVFFAITWSGLIFSILSSNLVHSSSSKQRQTKPSGLKLSLFLSAASGTGFIGFISLRGLFFWLSQSSQNTVDFIASLFSLFLLSLLGWKIAWGMSGSREEVNIPWSVYAAVFFLFILSFALVWTGSATGGVLLENSDQWMKSILDSLFKNSGFHFEVGQEYWSLLSFYLGVLFLGFSLSYWAVGRKENQWKRLSRLIPRTSEFIQNGYGVDHVFSSIRRLMKGFGGRVESIVDQKLWSGWIPFLFSKSIQRVSSSGEKFDQWLVRSLNRVSRISIEAPAQFLQVLLTGDLRWYLFLALCSGFALLTHFLMR